MKESPVQRLILDWLAAEHIFSLRMNTGVAKFDDRFVRFGVKGQGDILAFPKYKVWIGMNASPVREDHPDLD